MVIRTKLKYCNHASSCSRVIALCLLKSSRDKVSKNSEISKDNKFDLTVVLNSLKRGLKSHLLLVTFALLLLVIANTKKMRTFMETMISCKSPFSK